MSVTLQLQTNQSGLESLYRFLFNEDGSVTINDTTFTMADFTNGVSGFEPFCRFVVPLKESKVEKPFELLSQTAVGRVKANEYAQRLDAIYALTVVFLPETTGLQDARWRIIASGNADGSHAVEMNRVPDVLLIDSWLSGSAGFHWIPSLSLHQVTDLTVDGYGEFAVKYLDPDGNAQPVSCDIRLKANAGYLPKSKVTAVNGEAVFKVYALGLDVGDDVIIKAGIGEWTGLGTFSAKVK